MEILGDPRLAAPLPRVDALEKSAREGEWSRPNITGQRASASPRGADRRMGHGNAWGGIPFDSRIVGGIRPPAQGVSLLPLFRFWGGGGCSYDNGADRGIRR